MPAAVVLTHAETWPRRSGRLSCPLPLGTHTRTGTPGGFLILPSTRILNTAATPTHCFTLLILF